MCKCLRSFQLCVLSVRLLPLQNWDQICGQSLPAALHSSIQRKDFMEVRKSFISELQTSYSIAAYSSMDKVYLNGFTTRKYN